MSKLLLAANKQKLDGRWQSFTQDIDHTHIAGAKWWWKKLWLRPNSDFCLVSIQRPQDAGHSQVQLTSSDRSCARTRSRWDTCATSCRREPGSVGCTGSSTRDRSGSSCRPRAHSGISDNSPAPHCSLSVATNVHHVKYFCGFYISRLLSYLLL